MDLICRLCLKTNAGHYETVASIEAKYFQLVLPEIDINMIQSPIICQACIDLLQTAYTFKTNCIRTEELLKSYASKSCSDGLLLLSNVLKNQAAQDEIKVESDSDSIYLNLSESSKSEAKDFEVGKTETDIVKGTAEHLDRPFRCNICQKTFILRKTLMDHVRAHFVKSVCETCGKRYSSVSVLKRHLVNMHQIDPSDGSWREKVEIDQSAMQSALREHIQLHEKYHAYNRERIKSNSCTQCGRQFYNTASLNRHINDIHGGEIKNEDKSFEPSLTEFICDICGKPLAGKLALRAHKVTHQEKTIVCEFCDKRFRTNSRLKIHVTETHLGMPRSLKRKRNFSCEVCGLRTTSNHTLTEHKRVHTGEKPFKCKLCDKAFAQTSSLGTHMRTAHSDERSFTCEYCSKSFKLRGSLNKHIQLLHLSDKLEKKFVCSYCGKKYLMQCQLKKHQKWHIADRKYSCDICGKKFINNHSVRKHRVIHFPEKPHKCEICGKGFHQKSNIKIHMKVHGAPIV